MGHTQNGNNNAYCQDNEASWLDWEPSEEDQRFLDFVCRLIAIRKNHPMFRRRRFFQGRRIRGLKDIMWISPDGHEMTDEEWNQSYARCLGVFVAGEGIQEDDERGRVITDGDFIILLNSHYESIPFLIPQVGLLEGWTVLVDTSSDDVDGNSDGQHWRARDKFDLKGRSLVLLFRDRKRKLASDNGRAATKVAVRGESVALEK